MEPILNCQDIFFHACVFADCADFCFQYKKGDWAEYLQTGYYIPQITNAAFACELFLKSILRKRKVSYNNTHALKGLFLLLPDDIKQRIEKTLKITFGESLIDQFDEEYMEAISNEFQEWRYAFEKAVISCPLDFLMAFLNVLRNECCEILYDKTWEEYKGN